MWQQFTIILFFIPYFYAGHILFIVQFFLPVGNVRPRRRVPVRAVVQVVHERSEEPALRPVEQPHLVPHVLLSADRLLLRPLLKDPEAGLYRICPKTLGRSRRSFAEAHLVVVQAAEVLQVVADNHELGGSVGVRTKYWHIPALSVLAASSDFEIGGQQAV